MTYANATALTPKPIPATGLDLVSAGLAAVDTVNGNKFPVTSRTLLRVKVTAGAQCVVTPDVVDTLNGLTVTDPTFTVQATTGDWIYPIGKLAEYLKAKTGTQDAFVTFSAAATAVVYEPSISN